MLADRTLEDAGHLLYGPEDMNRKLRARVLAKRQHHTADQNAKRKAGIKQPPKPRRKQPKKKP
jgi:hypothetical protein